MQYKVPQNVDIEDKVIAGLTLRQFMFLMFAGGGVLILKYSLPYGLQGLFVPLSVLIGGFGIALAFLKINDRPFEVFLTSAFNSLLKPRKRIWLKEEVLATKEILQETKKAETPKTKDSLESTRSNLQKLATLVDTGVSNNSQVDNNVHDILEKTEEKSERFDKIIESVKPSTQKEATVEAMSSGKPQDSKFKYENIGLASESELEDILNKTKEKQKALEEQLENQKIEKFDR